MEQAADEDEEPPADATAADTGEDFLLTDTADDLDLRLARLEHLMERRPELLSSVMLRQNPHNVHEWHKRAKLFQANPTKQIICYTGGWVGGWVGPVAGVWVSWVLSAADADAGGIAAGACSSPLCTSQTSGCHAQPS
jgi:hypothetical protein